eukprot:6878926-Prymnesium_polylepis.1
MRSPSSECSAALRSLSSWIARPAGPNVSTTWVATGSNSSAYCVNDPIESMHSYLPPACPSLTLLEAVQCLRHRRLFRLYYVGDSVSYQLAFTNVCELGLGTHVGTRIEGTDFSLRLVSLPVGIELAFLWPKPASGTAQALGRALNSSMSSGHLQEPALWMVNAGLWHTIPLCEHSAECVEPEKVQASNDKDYEIHLRQLLEVLHSRARGHVIWRDTTAVHPGRMHKDASAAVRRKFAAMSNSNIRQLNARASHTMSSYPSLHPLDLYFAATRERAGGTAPGDIRHWRADVLQLLLQIAYLAWCEYV